MGTKLEELRDAPLDRWVAVIRNNPRMFRKVVGAVISEKDVKRVVFWWPKVRVGEGDGGGRAAARAQDSPHVHECDMCTHVCASSQALSWHRYDKHGEKHHMRKSIHSTVCECCLRDYWSRSRNFTHNSMP